MTSDSQPRLDRSALETVMPLDLETPTLGRRLGSVSWAAIAPRFIRFRDAPSYFGMDKNRFNADIRPSLTEIRIGRQGRAFDRLEMEAAAEEYKRRNGVPVAQPERSKPLWEIKRRQASPSVVGSGTSTNGSEERAFARALEQATCAKPGSILPSG